MRQAVVIDSGSGTSRAGFAGDVAPRITFPTTLGRSSWEGPSTLTQMVFVGDAATSKKSMLQLCHPIKHGVINDWVDMQKIWDYVFQDELRVNPSNHPVLLTEAPLNSKANREKMAQVMFETFNVPALYVARQAELCLYAAGVSRTGVVLDCGSGCTHAVPIYKGSAVRSSICTLDMGGEHLSSYLSSLLEKRGCSTKFGMGTDVIEDIKEKLCYVALDFEQEKSSASSLTQKLTLSDGRVITAGTERFQCPELLFNPALMGKASEGIAQLLHRAITQCDENLHKDLYANIMLTGGSTFFRGIEERLKKDLRTLAGPSMQINVFGLYHRASSAWLGGSKMAYKSSFQQKWITKEEFAEFGPSIVSRKCC